MICKDMTKNSLAKAVATCAVAVGASTLAVSAAAPASALTLFTDRTAWTTAVGSGYSISTEDFSSPIPDAPSITFQDYPIVSTGTGGTNKFNGVGSDGRYSGGIKRGNPNGSGGDYFDSITWTFPDQVKGFFFDYISMEKVVIEGDFNGNGVIDPAERIRVKDVGGSTGSFGLIGDALFKTISFTIDPAENNASENFKIDNLSVAVPSPALLPGLVGMGLAALRKKKQTKSSVA